MVPAQGVERLAERNEVTRDKSGALVNELVERVLAVGARLAPVDRAGIVGNRGPIESDVLPVTHLGANFGGRTAVTFFPGGQE
jgi:hypothetical protein